MGIVISTHLPPPVMIDSTEVLKRVTHMLCWSWAMYFSAAASSENDHGSMNLASNTASVPSTMPSRVAAIQGMAECLTWRWTSATRGTCEQWIKEGKGAIKWTRLSCRTFAANAVRLQLHALAYNLGNFLRTLAT